MPIPEPQADVPRGAERDALLILFTEVNEHMRATESKHLQLVIAYIGLLSLALSIMASPNQTASAAFVDVSWPKLIAYAVLSSAGCMSIFVLDTYRGWKQHYKLVTRTIARKPELDVSSGPDWLTHDLYRRVTVGGWTFGTVSPDNVPTYFIAAVTALSVAIFNYVLWSLVETRSVKIAAVVLSATAFLSFVAVIRVRVHKRMKRLTTEGS